jgi:hypothetical protein
MLDQKRTMLLQNFTADHMVLWLSLFGKHLVELMLETSKVSEMGSSRTRTETKY